MLMDSLSGPFVLLTAPWRPELSEGVCDLRGQFIPTSRGSSDAQPNKTTFCDRVGYRISNGPPDTALLGPLELTSSIDSLGSDLEEILVACGLYRDEAQAMLKTWRRSWFEEGSRLFYILPASFVATILHLTIHPSPAEIVRVFIGRLELITPATEKAIAAAVASRDTAALGKYTRFLEPILNTMMEKDPAQARQLSEVLDAFYESSFATAQQKPALAPHSPAAEPVRPQPCPVIDKVGVSGRTAGGRATPP
jgi:hypothetical protein